MAKRAILLDGSAPAARLFDEVRAQARALRDFRHDQPGLAVIRVGDDPIALHYLEEKRRAADEAGVRLFEHQLPAGTDADEIAVLVGGLNDDPNVHGILFQTPLPAALDLARALAAIDPAKDAGGMHPVNLGRLFIGGLVDEIPYTPRAALELLLSQCEDLSGLTALLLGQAPNVILPMVPLLAREGASVVLAHARDPDPKARCREADIVVSAGFGAERIRGDWLKPGALVIDAGRNPGRDGRPVGDVCQAEALAVAQAISPVPGGIGPLALAHLMANVVRAAQRLVRTARRLEVER
ncbi:MAG: bifunctional methylenetetrahydrofolate dehydrogenase/methenyltetrahydrofolate cyclohydrolase [Rhodospirillales bacterium]|nr:bifunctional methylenetetrahydrofolate dehydrogenase/methenyltetrahydrofolate cyclohydrolase [Rhodospirillales bacterium]